MRIYVFLIIISLTGCFGADIMLPKSKTIIHNDEIKSRYHPVNGNLTDNYHWKWCGIGLYLGIPIPIPFMLPICEVGRDENFVNNIRTTETITRIGQALYGCGPIIWYARVWTGNGELKFCDVIR